MTGEALPAEHNGDIWSREATKHGAILTGKNQRFLLGVSITALSFQAALRGRSQSGRFPARPGGCGRTSAEAAPLFSQRRADDR